MTRILATLALLSMVALSAAFVMGLTIGDLYAQPMPDDSTLLWARVHRLTGVAAALMVVFVESVIVTYFIGTSRWCREVVETYRFDPEIVRKSNGLKRRTFPWALAGMLGVVVVSALGAAGDRAANLPNPAAWVPWHLAGALLGIAGIGWSYFVAWNNVFTQHTIIQDLMAQVAQIRGNQGPDTPGTP